MTNVASAAKRKRGARSASPAALNPDRALHRNAVIWFAAFVPSVINSYAGVRSIEPYLIEAARSLGVRRAMLVREVLIPGALPLIFTGLRLSLQACWTTLVAAELLGAIVGLGHALYQAGLDIFPAMIVVGMIGVAIAGALMTMALAWLETRAMPWHTR